MAMGSRRKKIPHSFSRFCHLPPSIYLDIRRHPPLVGGLGGEEPVLEVLRAPLLQRRLVPVCGGEGGGGEEREDRGLEDHREATCCGAPGCEGSGGRPPVLRRI